MKQYVNKFLLRIIDEDILERCCEKVEYWIKSAQDGDEIELNLGSCKLFYSYTLKLYIPP